MHWVGVASIVRQTGFASLVFLTYRPGFPLFYLGLVECASVAAVTAFCVYVTRFKMGFAWPWPQFRFKELAVHIKEASPIGLTELAWSFMWYFSTVLLGFVFSDRTLGWFGASHRALMALNTFVWLYFFNLLPSISRCVTKPHEDLLALMDQSVRFASWAGLFTGAFLTAAAPTVLTLIYGPSFRPAAQSFAILVWMLPIAMLSGHHRYILIAYNRQKLLLLCTVISAAAAVILGFALVPFYRGQGAAWALVIAIFINFVLVYFCVRRCVVEVPVFRQLAAPLVTLAVSALVYAALVQWNPWAAIACGSAVYAAGLAWFSGRQLASFVRTIATRPARV
jgi:O-antigen/teichoic acid export membrane protein